MPDVARDRFTGFADVYDKFRPVPPEKVREILLGLLNKDRVETVVDLGSGTGLSTKMWSRFCGRLIGIEPNDDMRQIAAKNNPEIPFVKADSYDTRLAASSVDIVCCSQSLHWMEPTSSLKEIDRILKPGGMLAAVDCFWPVTISPASEIAYNTLFRRVAVLHERYKDSLPNEKQWPKNEHLPNFERCGFFDYAKETYFDNLEDCDAERFIGIALSQGHLQALIKNGVREITKDIDEFKLVAARDISKRKEMHVAYRMVIGRKKNERNPTE